MSIAQTVECPLTLKDTVVLGGMKYLGIIDFLTAKSENKHILKILT